MVKHHITSGEPTVKRILRQRGLSQAALARRVGCSRMAITLLLQGRMASPFLQREIAAVLGEPEAALWGALWWVHKHRSRRLSKATS